MFNEEEQLDENDLELAQAARVLDMSRSEGWAILKREFNYYADSLQQDINTVEKNEMVYTRKDLKILEFNLLKEIVQFPEKFLLRLYSKRNEVDDLDVYSSTSQEI